MQETNGLASKSQKVERSGKGKIWRFMRMPLTLQHEPNKKTITMKRISFIMAMFALFAGNALAQEYHPFVEEGKTWTIECRPQAKLNDMSSPSSFYTLRLSGDTVIYGKTWKKLYRDAQYITSFREENGKVYAAPYSGTTEEILAYDFTLKNDSRIELFRIGDEEHEWAVSGGWQESDVLIMQGTDMFESSVGPLKRLFLSHSGNESDTGSCIWWIEGVGDTMSPLAVNKRLRELYGGRYEVMCECRVGGDILYEADPFGTKAYSQAIQRPLVEEGKTWVTENYAENPNVPNWFITHQLRGDTIIGEWNCKKLYRYDGSFPDPDKEMYYCAMFETNGKTYMIGKGENSPQLLYDFSAKKGDNVSVYCFPGADEYVQLEIVSDELDWDTNLYGRKLVSHDEADGRVFGRWLYGIGDKCGLFGTSQWACHLVGGGSSLVCCYVGDEVLYGSVPSGIAYTSQVSAPSLHDLQGRRLNAEPQKGVFIRGGKKVAK